jgi:hypothetical protein
MIFQHNPDDLFELQTPAGCFGNPFMRPFLKTGIANPYGLLKHGDTIECKTVLSGLNNSSSVNGSLVLLTPCKEDFKEIIKLTNDMIYGYPNSYSTVDEQAISEHYSLKNTKWTHIDPIYEAVPWKWSWVPQANKDLSKLIGIHYNHDKPWELGQGTDWPDTAVWWGIFKKLYNELPSDEKSIGDLIDKSLHKKFTE